MTTSQLEMWRGKASNVVPRGALTWAHSSNTQGGSHWQVTSSTRAELRATLTSLTRDCWTTLTLCFITLWTQLGTSLTMTWSGRASSVTGLINRSYQVRKDIPNKLSHLESMTLCMWGCTTNTKKSSRSAESCHSCRDLSRMIKVWRSAASNRG